MQNAAAEGEPSKIRIPVIPIPSVRVDNASPENWGGASLSARGLDALQAIREAADHTLLRQGSEQSLMHAGSTLGSPVSLPQSPQSPPRSPTPMSRSPLTARSRRRARGGRTQQNDRERSPAVHFRMVTARREAVATERAEPGPVNFTASILPPTPPKYDGMPPRRLRLPKAKTADPPVPMYSTAEAQTLLREHAHESPLLRSSDKREREAPVRQPRDSGGDPAERPDEPIAQRASQQADEQQTTSPEKASEHCAYKLDRDKGGHGYLHVNEKASSQRPWTRNLPIRDTGWEIGGRNDEPEGESDAENFYNVQNISFPRDTTAFGWGGGGSNRWNTVQHSKNAHRTQSASRHHNSAYKHVNSKVIAAMTAGKAPLIAASELARIVSGEIRDKPAARPPISLRQQDNDSDSERRLEPGPGEAGEDVLEEDFSRAPDTTPEQRALMKQQMHHQRQQQKNQPQMQQQTSKHRAEGAEEEEGRERQSHQRGISKIASADSNTSFARMGSAFSMVKNGGFERIRSSGSDSTSERMVPQLRLQNITGPNLGEEHREYDVLRLDYDGSEKDSDHGCERGTHKQRKDVAGGAQLTAFNSSQPAEQRKPSHQLQMLQVPANYSYKIHPTLYQNSTASNGSSSGGNFRWQSSDLMNGRRHWSSAKGERPQTARRGVLVETTNSDDIGTGRGLARSRSAERRTIFRGDGKAVVGSGREAMKSGVQEMGLSGAQAVAVGTSSETGSSQGSRVTTRPQTSRLRSPRVVSARPQTSRYRSPVGFSGEYTGNAAVTERRDRQGDCSQIGAFDSVAAHRWGFGVVGVAGNSGWESSPPATDRSGRVGAVAGVAGMGIWGGSPPGSLAAAGNQRGGGVSGKVGMISLSGLEHSPTEAMKWKSFPAPRPRGILSGRN